jgi:hypothetical protein
MVETDETAPAVYIISVVNYDEFLIRFATLSEERSLELFDVVRKDLIADVDDSLNFWGEREKEGATDVWPGYRTELLQYKDALTGMKPGDNIRGDRPYIEKVKLV